MRKRGLILTAVGLLSWAAVAHAGSGHWIGYQAGAALPQGDFADIATLSPDLGLQYTYLVRGTLGLGAGIGYCPWTVTSDRRDAIETRYGSDATYSVSDWQFSVHGILAVPVAGRVRPYLKGGLAYYDAMMWTSVPALQKSGIFHGHFVGGGFSVPLNEDVSLGVVGTYHHYGDGHRHLQIAYTTLALQLDWRMHWSSKL